MNLPVRLRRRSIRGFTLLEVLVASAILGVVMMVLLSTLSTSMSLWRNTESKAGADRESRATALLLAQDLANVVMPENPRLWPRTNVQNGITFLQFLTAKPPEYATNAGDVGDVCYVEYAFVPSPTSPSGRELHRMFWGSQRTYNEIIRSNFLRGGRRGTGITTNSDFQMLGVNLLTNNQDAVRGLEKLFDEMNRTNFVILSTNHPLGNLLPVQGDYTASNRPVAIEVSFAVADPETLRNTIVLANRNFILRNAGLYSTRYYLPKPPNVP